MTIAIDLLPDVHPAQGHESSKEPTIPLAEEAAMSGSMMEVIGSSTTPAMGRRSMALSDIDPKYVSQNAIWEASHVETSRGSIRIQHLTAAPPVTAGSRTSTSSIGSVSGGIGSAVSLTGGATNNPRFPKLEECFHFHYDCVELPQIRIQIIRDDDPSKPIALSGDENQDKCAFSIEVVAGGQSWCIRRTHKNIQMLDHQLHSCVWDRTFSHLEKVLVNQEDQQENHAGCREFVTNYLARLNDLPTDSITCGTVLSFFELDNRGRHIVSSDDCAINTPAVAAACAIKKYVAQAADEISFEVGEMISVIDMPESNESIWWRGKHGFHSCGFFPRDAVQVIGDKVPAGLPSKIVPSVRRLQRLSVSSSTCSSAPDKPVLRKHGKLIAFFRSFILSRPSRRKLKQSGILRERVFSCDLAEHLMNTGNEIPTVLKCCAEFIEKHGIVDGVYRLSGITSNIQKLRNAFDEDKIPNLEGDLAIKQDIHAVSSLLKMFFRELPNPLCTYQLYEKFVAAAKASDEERLLKMREVVAELPPPHYRTLQYLMQHLSRVALRSNGTGMTPKNMAIVWAPNLIRCRELEAGGVAALKGIGVQAVVTEYLIRHADLIFNDKLPENFPATTTVLTQKTSESSSRPKSLAISSPIKLMSLEEAQERAKAEDRSYIEVGGGPSSLPPKYHTVIDLPRRGGGKNKRSAITWKHFFTRNRSFSKPPRKHFTPGDITVITRNMPLAGPEGMQTNWAGRLRPVKSVESLVSSPLYNINNSTTSEDSSRGTNNCNRHLDSNRLLDSESVMEEMETSLSRSSPASPVITDVVFHAPPETSMDPRSLNNPKTHNRSISHDSYFEFGEFKNSNQVYIDETLEEETMSQSSKLSMDLSSSEVESNPASPIKNGSVPGRSKSEERENKAREPFKSPATPPPSAASLIVPLFSESHPKSSSSENMFTKRNSTGTSPISSPVKSKQQRPSKWRDSEMQTSQLKLSDVGVSTEENDYCSSAVQTNFVAVESSTFVSMEVGRDAYEVDRNSSMDESSELSTPEDPHPSTNIIYSPLVNELSSTSSAEHLNLLQSRSSTQKLSSNRSSNSVEDCFATSANVCLVVCPLYEAGVRLEQLEESGDIPPSPITASVSVSEVSHSTADTCEQIPSTIQPIHEYENEYFPKSTEPSSYNIPKPAKMVAPLTKEVCHIYENERIYENTPIAPLRKRTCFPAQLSIPSTSTSSSRETSPSKLEDAEVVPVPKPKAKEPLPTTCIDVNYPEKPEGPYENLSEQHYEGNIYEDIDSDDEKNKQDENYSGSGGSCRYEAVGLGQSNLSAKSPNSNSNPRSPVPATAMQESSDDDEYSENYESVRFQKVEDQLVAHHYSEIEEKKTLTPEEEQSSSQSNSKTDDMFVYLEAQTPSCQLPTDSLERSSEFGSKSNSQSTSDENVQVKNLETITDITSPSADDEIHFIDSPLVVENPVYTLEMEGIDPEVRADALADLRNGEDDVSINESVSLNLSTDDGDKSFHVSPTKNATELKAVKLLGRCNSAPLSETKDLVITDILRQSDFSRPSSGTDDNGENQNHSLTEVGVAAKLSLAKRLSEPSLAQLASPNSPSFKTDEFNAAAWKLADAKRLANRKQSVKELLCKFESRDSTPSPTNSTNILPHFISKDTQGPGLPRPTSQTHFKHIRTKANHGSGNSSARFQHHRFSVGDILLSQSMSESEDLISLGSHSPSPKNSMIRSDTYPELRMKGQSSSKENLHLGGLQSSSNINDTDDGSLLVPEKVHNALRQAMSSVDMNDPNTRERIEKYKEERRTFLRQKITSEINVHGGNSSSDEKSSFPVFQKEPAIEALNNQLNANESTSTRSNSSSLTLTFVSNQSPISESPRKRAFTEDATPNLSQSYSTKTKSIKTEPDFTKYTEEEITSTKTISTNLEEINVKEKIALWTLQKKEMSRSTLSCAEISPKSTSSDASQKPFVKPVLRREVTTSSIEISKCQIRGDGNSSGKKIKDMAAFFEAKRL